MTKILALLAVFLALPLAAQAQTTYYVDETDGGASDSNTGAIDDVWLTLAKCASTLGPGDTCIIKATGGTYAGFTQTGDGAPGSPITYQCESGGNTASLGTITLNSGNQAADYFVVENCAMHGFSAINTSVTGASPSASHITIRNNTINNGGGYIIQLRADDVLIEGNTFVTPSDDPIHVFGQRFTIRNNTIQNGNDTDDDHDDCFWQAYAPTSSYALIGYGLIENNSCIDYTGANVHAVLTNNTAALSEGPKYIIVRYNRIGNIGSQAVLIDANNADPDTRNNSVYNNTFYKLYQVTGPYNRCCALNASKDSNGLNNIFYDAMTQSNAEGFTWASGPRQECNLYYDPDGSMTFSGAAASESRAVKNQDPLLQDPDNGDFALSLSSPAIDAGCELTNVASGDTGTGTVLIVDDSALFSPGWGDGVGGDCIAVGTIGNTACITAINYSTDEVTLDAGISRNDGDNVWLYSDSDGTVVLNGSAPDIGAVESGAADTTDPTLNSSVPTDGASGVAVSANIVLTFSENAVSGSGNITIVETGVGNFEQIDIDDARITISGTKVTINPAGTMSYSTGYHLTVDSTAIDDAVGNSYAGIADTTTLNWTTESVAQALVPSSRVSVR